MIAKLQKQLDTFLLLTSEEQQRYTLEILEWVRGYNEYLHDLHAYVSAGSATGDEYRHIYTAALETQEEVEASDLATDITRLTDIQSDIHTRQLREQWERELEQSDANSLLSTL